MPSAAETPNGHRACHHRIYRWFRMFSTVFCNYKNPEFCMKQAVRYYYMHQSIRVNSMKNRLLMLDDAKLVYINKHTWIHNHY